MPDVSFDDSDALDALEAMGGADFDALDFGLVVMDRSNSVTYYNEHEVAHTGFERDDVIGRSFFESIGPCMNNYLVAQRFEDAADGDAGLDETIDYVFTLKMKPTPVTLRLLARAGSPRQYLAVRFS